MWGWLAPSRSGSGGHTVSSPRATGGSDVSTQSRCPVLPQPTALWDEQAKSFLNAHHMRKCSARHLAADLTACDNLAVGGTGSRSLTEALKTVGVSHAHHRHPARIGFATSATKRPCWVLTVRDPATRLESGFRYDLTHPSTPAANSLVHPTMPTLADFVEALRNTSHAGHRLAVLLYEQSVTSPSRGFQRHVSLMPAPPSGGCQPGSQIQRKCVGSHFLRRALKFQLLQMHAPREGPAF